MLMMPIQRRRVDPIMEELLYVWKTGCLSLKKTTVTRIEITYVAPNDQEHSPNFKIFSIIKLAYGLARKQSKY